jgi:two-component system, LytTR family, response regulator LytT
MEKQVKILVVEDEMIVADYMQDCLQKLGYRVTDICISYDEAVAALEKDKPDFILLDITLKGQKSGIELGQFINTEHRLPFAFITSHSDRDTVDKAKKALPYSYLIKPFSEEELYAAVETGLQQFASRHAKEDEQEQLVYLNGAIFIKHKSRFVKIRLADIMYAEASDNYSSIITESAGYTLKTTLRNLLSTFPANFLQVHKSFVINLEYIKSFDTEEIILENNKRLPIGKTHYAAILERLKFIKG